MSSTESLPALSEAQIEVMHVVWRLNEATLNDVWTELTAKRPLAKNTVQTLLARLVDKGWLTYRQEGNGFIYRGTCERNTAHKQILQRVVDVAFQGSTEGLLVSLLQDTSITPDEAARLRNLIDEAERNAR